MFFIWKFGKNAVIIIRLIIIIRFELAKIIINIIIDIFPSSEEEIKTSTHEGEEFIYVLEGELEIEYGKEKYLLKEGDSIFYDSIVKHHVHGAPGKSAKILAVVYIPF